MPFCRALPTWNPDLIDLIRGEPAVCYIGQQFGGGDSELCSTTGKKCMRYNVSATKDQVRVPPLWPREGVQHIMATQIRHTSTWHLGPTLCPKRTAMARQDVAVHTHYWLSDPLSKLIHAFAMRKHLRRSACSKRGLPFERRSHRQYKREREFGRRRT